MAARWIALAAGLITFTIAGFFVAVALWPRAEPMSVADRPTAAEPRGLRMTGRAWIVSADIAWRQAHIEVNLAIRDEGGRAVVAAPPEAELRMLDMVMGPAPLVLEPLSPGRWRGTGSVSMPGRWTLVVTVEGEELAFQFTAPEM